MESSSKDVDKLTNILNKWKCRTLVSLGNLFVGSVLIALTLSLKELVTSVYINETIVISAVYTGLSTIGFIVAGIKQYKCEEKLNIAKQKLALQVEVESDLIEEVVDNNKVIDKENHRRYQALVVNATQINLKKVEPTNSNVRVLRNSINTKK